MFPTPTAIEHYERDHRALAENGSFHSRAFARFFSSVGLEPAFGQGTVLVPGAAQSAAQRLYRVERAGDPGCGLRRPEWFLRAPLEDSSSGGYRQFSDSPAQSKRIGRRI